MIILERACVLTLILPLPHALYFPEPQPLLPTASPSHHPACCWNNHQRFGNSGRAPTYPARLIINFSNQTSLSWTEQPEARDQVLLLSLPHCSAAQGVVRKPPGSARPECVSETQSLWSGLSPSKLEYRGRTQKVIASLPGDSDACSGSNGDTLCGRR